MPHISISLPHTLRRSRLQIRPTRYGIVFILLLLGMFAGSVNYNNNLGFLLTFLLGSITLVSIAQTHKNVCAIKILSCSTKPVFAGEPAIFEFFTEDSGINRSRIGFAFSKGKPTIIDFVKGSKNHIKVPVHASYRGLLKPKPLLVFSDYPLGLFRVQSRLHLNLECIVYPQPKTGRAKTLAENTATGTGGGIGAAGSDEFQGLKGYLPGDPLHRISWKASSRGRGLFTKDFNGNYGASFYFDWYLLRSRDTEHRLSLLCHAILKAQQHNLIYGLKLPGKTIEPGNGRNHKNRCLKTLALFNGLEDHN